MACELSANQNQYQNAHRYAPLADDVEAPPTPRPRYRVAAGDPGAGYEPLLVATDVVVALTGLECSLTLRRGARLALSGETGAGKTQLLKTLARLAPSASGSLAPAWRAVGRQRRLTLARLAALEDVPAPAWRAAVAFVPQDRATLPGSPREHFEAVQGYAAQRERQPIGFDAVVAAAARWRLPSSKLDEAWATLSGGEAQRAGLAIALALSPEVLLLDEPTSACDAETAALVEADLKKFPGAMLVVTHDAAQAARLCHARLALERVN